MVKTVTGLNFGLNLGLNLGSGVLDEVLEGDKVSGWL